MIPSSDAWNQVKEHWPDRSHIMNDHMAFVAEPGIGTATEIKKTLGISTEIEATLPHLDTKADIKDVKIWVLTGVLSAFAIAIGLAVRLARLFPTGG